MLRFAADENFNNDIVRGLRRRKTNLDIVRVQEAGLSGAVDPDVLEWAAREGRVLLRPGDARCPTSESRRQPNPRY